MSFRVARLQCKWGVTAVGSCVVSISLLALVMGSPTGFRESVLLDRSFKKIKIIGKMIQILRTLPRNCVISLSLIYQLFYINNNSYQFLI